MVNCTSTCRPIPYDPCPTRWTLYHINTSCSTWHSFLQVQGQWYILFMYPSSLVHGAQPLRCTGSTTRRRSVSWWTRWAGNLSSIPPPSLLSTTLRLDGTEPMGTSSMSHWSLWLKTKVHTQSLIDHYLPLFSNVSFSKVASFPGPCPVLESWT